jgi:hypothetical protein
MDIETKPRRRRTPEDWYTVITSKENHWQATDWCTQQYGRRWSVVDNRAGTWCCFWAGQEQFGSYKWQFENEHDAVLFTLRWL